MKEQDRLVERFSELKQKAHKETLTEQEKKEFVIMSLKPEKYEESNWYTWNIQNWGTKWGICHPSLDDSKEGELFYSFDTAWTPCIPVVLKMSELFPKLNFNYKYWEGGSGFRGIFICKNNNIIKDKEYEFKGNRGG